MRTINDDLIDAVRYESVEIVKLLLDNGADCTYRNNYAIKWASEEGHTEVVEFLKQHGAVL